MKNEPTQKTTSSKLIDLSISLRLDLQDYIQMNQGSINTSIIDGTALPPEIYHNVERYKREIKLIQDLANNLSTPESIIIPA